jgi:hypothetical protein
MKTIFTMCAITLVAGTVMLWRTLRTPTQFGTFTGAPQTSVVDVISKPAQFIGKTIVVEGTVRQQCRTMGCFFFFVSGKNTLRVDLQEVAMNAPMREGHMARVEGQIVPYDHGYQFFASAIEFE